MSPELEAPVSRVPHPAQLSCGTSGCENMAAAVRDSRGSAGKKLKHALKRKKKMKTVAKAAASELEDEGQDAADVGGNVPRRGGGRSQEPGMRRLGSQPPGLHPPRGAL